LRPRRGREASFDRSLARPHGDVVARPEASVGGHECKIAVEAMGDQHAVEWIAIIPVERARSFCVRPADRDLGKARRTGGGARRSLERELGVNLIDTFNVYYGGGPEEFIGEAMGHKRKPGMLIAFAAVELLFNQQNKWAFVDKPLEPLIAAMRPDRPHRDQAMACLKDQSKADVMVAIGKRATDEIKMTGTPTFVIDGKVYGVEPQHGPAEGDPRPVGQEVALLRTPPPPPHQARNRRPASAPTPMQMRVASGYQVATNSGESSGQEDA